MVGTEGAEGEGGITKGHEQTFKGVGYIHYLDGCDGFMGVYICQNLSNQML